MSVPKLRFKEFDGDWKQEALKNFATFSKGKGISKSDISEDGINFCIRYGELYTTYGQVINFIQSKTNVSKDECVLSKSGDVIIPASGETQIDIATASCVLHDDIILGGDLNILSHQENGSWLAYYLSSAKKLDIAQLAQGNSVVHLYSSQLKDLKINKPSKEEQTKIASFLSAVDEKIAQLTQKHELLSQYKQGMMQKLFSQQIRFKADDGSEFGEWEELKFNFFIKERSQICSDSSIELCSLTIEKGVTEKTDRYIRDFLVKDEKNAYKEVHFNDFVMNPMNLRFGAIAKSNIDRIVKISKYYNVFYIDEKIINLKYFVSFATSKPMIDFYNLMSTGSLVEKRRNHFKDFIQYEKKFPCLEEQAKIANFLSAIDQKIEVVAQQIEQAKQWKKGLLQQMFV